MSASPDDVLVVGVGASAGGVEALRAFFAQVPANSGCAYVVILHLSPEHESQLAAILQDVAAIPVARVSGRVRVEPDHAYVVPPGQHLTMDDGELIVTPSTRPEERRSPVDLFFRTLGDSQGARAVGVVLSGTGANGSLGLKRIKECGGAIFVQDPREAAFGEMPRSAVATNLVDHVLPVEEIPAQISAYRATRGALSRPANPAQHPEAKQQALREIVALLRVRTGHDFFDYRRATMLRRIQRRVSVLGLPDLSAYAAHLRDHPDEMPALLASVLIPATTFFRDAEAFAALEHEILPHIYAGKGAGDLVRIWVAGCATGEEAYSIAMLCAERAADRPDVPGVQIFATDINEAAIGQARQGLYAASDMAELSPERVGRFFVREDDRYRVRRELRERILFATHNLLRDPPFSHLDLIACRNVLITLSRDAQRRAAKTFHFALRPGGYLFLGSAEVPGENGELFVTVSRRHHLFQRQRVASRRPRPAASRAQVRLAPSLPAPGPSASPLAPTELDLPIDLHRQLLEQYAPPSIIVTTDYQLVHVSPRAAPYLRLPAGDPTANLLLLLRPELLALTHAAIADAVQRRASVDTAPVALRVDEHDEQVVVRVRPTLRRDDATQGYILILFEPDPAPREAGVMLRTDATATQLSAEVVRLRHELRASSARYQEQAEQLRSANEELRASSEELETQREELQALNEELRTVNQELKVAISEATLHSSNLQNLIESADVGTIFLDRRLAIQLFTPAARRLFNLIPADRGRPFSDITHRLIDVDILADAERVLGTLRSVEREAHTAAGEVYLLRALPYRTDENRSGGVVLSFFDITTRKHAEERQAYLLRLSDALRPLADPAAIQAVVAQAAIAFFNVDRCSYCEIEQGNVVIPQGLAHDGVPSMAGVYALSNLPILQALIDAGQPLMVRDVQATDGLDAQLRGLCLQHQINSLLGVPVLKHGRPVGILCLAQRAPRDWSSIAMELVVETAERARAAVERAHIEAALRESEARHRALFDAVDEGVCLIERLPLRPDGRRDYRYLAMNPAMRAMFGIPDLSGQSIRDHVPDEVEDWYDDYDRVLESGRPIRFERESAPQGLVLELFVTRLEDRTGRRLLVVIQDVTARHRAAAALRASEERFRLLAEQARDMIYRYRIAPEPGFEYVSPSATALTGYTPEEHYADPHLGFALVEPEDRHLLAQLTDGSTTGPVEMRWRRKDGSLIWVEQLGRLFVDEAGRPAAVEGIARDITARKAVEAQVQVALAAEQRARVEAELAAGRTQRLQAVTAALAAALTLDEVIQAVLTFGREATGAAVALLALLNPGGEALERVGPALPDAPPQLETIPLDAPLPMAQAARTLAPVWLESPALAEAAFPGFGAAMGGWAIESYAGIPLVTARGLVGVLALGFTTARPFPEGERALLLAMAQQYAQAITRARLYAEVQEAQARLQQLSWRLLEVQEEERSHLARELHDELGQELTGLRLALELIGRQSPAARDRYLREARQTTQELIARVRALSLDLRPAMLDDAGLLPALLWLVRRFRERTGIAVELHHQGLEGRLPPAVETVAYRVVQEALTNIARHAAVDRATVHVLGSPERLIVQIQDSGRGFVLGGRLSGGQKSGLAGMQERVGLLGGTLSIETEPGRGTWLTVELPLRESTPR